jgi:hypothetical protein
MISDDLLLYYKSVIRPVLEYACPVWQSGLTADQRDRLESIQRRALCLISGSSDYEMQCVLFDIEPIGVRLDNLARSFFRRIYDQAYCLNYLLPMNAHLKPCVDCVTLIYYLASFVELIAIFNFKSFLPYALNSK